MSPYRRGNHWTNALTSCVLIFSQVIYPVRGLGALVHDTTAHPRQFIKSSLLPAQAEARFMEALNRLINLPADAPAEARAIAEQNLQRAAGQYQLALQNAPKSTEPVPAGSPYLYTANAVAPNGDGNVWTLLAHPEGDPALFEQSFDQGLAGRSQSVAPEGGASAAEAPAAPASEAHPRETRGELAAPAFVPTVRQCGRVRVVADRLDVGENGDSSSAEWRFDVSVNGNNRDWDVDGVEDNTTHNLGYEWFVDLSSDSTSFSINSGGYEYDSPDPDDPLPGAGATLDSGNNWNIGGDRTIGNSNSDASYTLHYFVSCDRPWPTGCRPT